MKKQPPYSPPTCKDCGGTGRRYHGPDEDSYTACHCQKKPEKHTRYTVKDQDRGIPADEWNSLETEQRKLNNEQLRLNVEQMRLHTEETRLSINRDTSHMYLSALCDQMEHARRNLEIVAKIKDLGDKLVSHPMLGRVVEANLAVLLSINALSPYHRREPPKPVDEDEGNSHQ